MFKWFWTIFSLGAPDYRAIFNDFTQFANREYCLPMYFSLNLSWSSAYVIVDQRLYWPLPTFLVKRGEDLERDQRKRSWTDIE